MTHRERINRARVMRLVNDGISFGYSVYKVARRHKLDREAIVGLVEAVRMQLKRTHRVSSWPR